MSVEAKLYCTSKHFIKIIIKYYIKKKNIYNYIANKVKILLEIWSIFLKYKPILNRNSKINVLALEIYKHLSTSPLNWYNIFQPVLNFIVVKVVSIALNIYTKKVR